MEKEDIGLIIESQRKFFTTGKTLNTEYRIKILKKLRSLIILHEQDIVDALWKDFHKPEFEVIATETRFVIKELTFAIRKLRSWSRSRRVYTPIMHPFAKFCYSSTLWTGIDTITLEFSFSACFCTISRGSCCRQLCDP